MRWTKARSRPRRKRSAGAGGCAATRTGSRAIACSTRRRASASSRSGRLCRAKRRAMPGPRGGRRRSPPPCPPVRSRRLPFSRRRGSRLRARLHPLTRRGPRARTARTPAPSAGPSAERDASGHRPRRATHANNATKCIGRAYRRAFGRAMSNGKQGTRRWGTHFRHPRHAAVQGGRFGRNDVAIDHPPASRAEAEQPRYATSGPRRIGARPFGTRTQMRVPRLRADTTSTAPPSRPISSRTLMSPKPV